VSDFTSTFELGTPPTWGAVEFSSPILEGDIIGAGGSHTPYVMNKTWHTLTSQWVRWLTVEPDNLGLYYPGPGSFGECSDFRLEIVTYQPVE
jgi:hypothetical protein